MQVKTLLPQTGPSLCFTRAASWHTRFLQPTRIHNLDDTLIGSAGFARLTGRQLLDAVKARKLVYPATRSTQPCIPPGSLNRVPASAGVNEGMSPLPGGR